MPGIAAPFVISRKVNTMPGLPPSDPPRRPRLSRNLPRRPGGKAFLADRRGGVAVLIGFAMVGLIGILALAMDVSAAINAHTRLREAANVAVLTAVRQAAVDTSQNSNASLVPSQNAGADRFIAQASNVPKVATPQVSVTVTRNGLTINATATFQASYTTQIAGALSGMSPSVGNLASIPLGGTVAAQQQVGSYVDIQVLMDTSNSMAISATAADTALLNWATTYISMWVNPWPNYALSTAGNPIVYGNGNELTGNGWQPCSVACHASWDNASATSFAAGNYNTWRISPALGIGGPNTSPGLGQWYRQSFGYSTGGYGALPPLAGAQNDPYSQFFTSGGGAPAVAANSGNFVPNQNGNPDANASTYNPVTYDYYALARYLNVTLRIDLLKSAVASIANAVATAPDGDKFQFGFYTFSLGTTPLINPPQSAATAGSIISRVEVDRIAYPTNPGSDTNVGTSIGQFTNYVMPAGDGSSQAQAKKSVIIMTDGIEDFRDSGNGQRDTNAFNYHSCDTLKASTTANPPGKGASVFVLQAASAANFPADPGHTSADLLSASAAAMQACASDPSYYFLASTPAQIAAATQSIINLALSKPTVLTQSASTLPPSH